VIAVVGAVVLARRPRVPSVGDGEGDADGTVDAPPPGAAVPTADDGGVESTGDVARAVADTVTAAHGRSEGDGGTDRGETL
jgi:hypothetical protein